MRNGGRHSQQLRTAARWLIVPALALAMIGCAQRRQGLLGGSSATTIPKSPGLASARPEPGLRVRAPFVDVQVADKDKDGQSSKAARRDESAMLSSRSPRVGLFRNSSSGGSLGTELPID